jgi:hypothetical protein
LGLQAAIAPVAAATGIAFVLGAAVGGLTKQRYRKAPARSAPRID